MHVLNTQKKTPIHFSRESYSSSSENQNFSTLRDKQIKDRIFAILEAVVIQGSRNNMQ